MTEARHAGKAGDSAAGRFPASLVRKLSESLPPAAAAESAVPSYTHRIPLIRWLMFRRLDVIEKMALAELARSADHAAVLSALDYGCGVGMMIPALAPRVETLYLCDEQLAPARVAAEWFHAANVVCLLPDELSSGIGDSRLDVVIAADVLEHVDDLPAVVDAFRRKLRPGGALLVSGPTENRAYHLGRKIAGFTGEYHVRSVFEVEDGIQEGGFVRERLLRLPFAFAPALFRITLWRRTGT
jgi:SAM-dependent methyltransferase